MCLIRRGSVAQWHIRCARLLHTTIHVMRMLAAHLLCDNQRHVARSGLRVKEVGGTQRGAAGEAGRQTNMRDGD